MEKGSRLRGPFTPGASSRREGTRSSAAAGSRRSLRRRDRPEEREDLMESSGGRGRERATRGSRRGRRSSRSSRVSDGRTELGITAARATHDEGDVAPAKKKLRGKLQLGVTEDLLQKVSEYVQQELLVTDVEKKVSDAVKFSADAEEKGRQEEIVKRYIEAYISALLRYRQRCADAYSDGIDDTSRVPIFSTPGGKRDDPAEGRKLFDALREEGLPTKVPEGVRVISRNSLLLAFRCFDKHRDGKMFFPFLRPNKDLLNLPGFDTREEILPTISIQQQLAYPFVWNALRGSIENYSLDDRKFKAIRLRRIPGVESFGVLKQFWKEYIEATLRRKLHERLPSALARLEDLHGRNQSESWLRVMNVLANERTDFTELALQAKCLGVPIYDQRDGSYFLRPDDVCVLWVEERSKDRSFRLRKVMGFMHRTSTQNMRKTWYICVPGLWARTGSNVSVQAVPFYRMTTDFRRHAAAALMGNMCPSVHRTCFSPEVAPNIISARNYQYLPGDQAAQMIFDHYQEELNMAQGEVLDKVMRVLSTSQTKSGNSLIAVQGPPGTGKSKTIVCTVALLLAKLELPENEERKILLCAPSNAAVDVIARRLLKGVHVAVPDEKNSSGFVVTRQTPSVLRIGPGCLDPGLRAININNKVEDKLDAMGIFDARERGRSRVGIEKNLLKNAKVWCSTLMNIRQGKYDEVSPQFLAVIIDEAGQAIELDCYMPLGPFGSAEAASLCILVGDTKQLCPFEDIKAGREIAEKGLMGRIVDYMQHASNNCVRLQEQYRMHHAIAAFPANEFYSGHLRNAGIVYDGRIFERPYHFDAAGRFGPVTFIDTVPMRNNEEEYPRGCSACNYCEAKVVESLVVCLGRLHRSALDDGIVLLSPYSRQLDLLRHTSSRVPEMRNISISTSTVDSMQGEEAGVVVMSTVRSNPAKDLGFLVDYRRMNVGMTRARYSLIVVGNSRTLEADRSWRRFIEYCKDDDNECTHYVSIQGQGVDQNTVTRMLFPEKLISTGTFWRFHRF